MSVMNVYRYEKMWGDECYYNIEGECEFFQDWIMQTKDEVFCEFSFKARVSVYTHYNSYTIIYASFKVRIFVILGEWSMHLALIEAMYKLKLIGRSDMDSNNVKRGSQLGTEDPKYFVVGVEKDEWDIKGMKI